MAVIKVSGVHKKFKVFYDKSLSFKEKILFRNRSRHEERWVLKGLDFEVQKGEALGLVGENGCGKSTLLKLMTRIMFPDKGRVEVRGRVSSLIELGAGFHADMSGRENIYINASIFGLTRKEIDDRLQTIIDFSELGQFIDNPVRMYSSGMYMRLAFSVAIHVDADVLLIDEILGVGDVNFQMKCFEKLLEIKSNGTTIVIVSHSLEQIEQICDKSIWIAEGVIREIGIPKFVHESYLNAMDKRRAQAVEAAAQAVREEAIAQMAEVQGAEEPANPAFCAPGAIRMGNLQARFTDVRVYSGEGAEKTVFATGEEITVEMKYACDTPGIKGNFGMAIFREDGVHCYGTNIDIECNSFVEMRETGEVTMTITNNSLLPGKYLLDIAIHSETGTRYDDIRRVFEFRVMSTKRDEGLMRLETEWSVDGYPITKRIYE